MSVLQVLVLAAVGAQVLRLICPPNAVPPLAVLSLSVLTAGVVILQVLLDGWRWALAPAYVLACLIGLSALLPAVPGPVWMASVAGAIGLFGASVGLSVLAALLWLPDPSGQFPVGTTTWQIAIAPRAGVQLPEVLPVSVWYPARARERGQPYGDTDARVSWRRRLVNMRTSPAAAPAGDPNAFPLIVYVPLWLGSRTSNSVLAAELASHGYVVAAIDDVGLLIPSNSQLRMPLDFSSQDAFRSTLEVANARIGMQARLVSLLLDVLAERDGDGLFGQPGPKPDVTRVAVLGYSVGGAVAVEACANDDRCKAAMNLDGWLFGHSGTSRKPKPYFVATNISIPHAGTVTGPTDDNPQVDAMNREDITHQRAALERGGGYVLTIPSLGHEDFSDSPFFSSARLNGRQAFDPVRVSRVIAAHAVDFFDAVLKGGALPDRLTKGPADPIATLDPWMAAQTGH